jgi:glutamate synthase (NADPH/NADH) large chain
MGGLHHHLVRAGTRTRVSIVLETGEAREVHHFAVLLGYGADAINPYMAFESLHQMIEDDMLDMEFEKAVELPEGIDQGRGQDHGQDGDLDRGLLPGSSDL